MTYEKPDVEEIPSDYEDVDDRVTSREIPDDDGILSEEQESIERISPRYKTTCSNIYLFVETGDVSLLNKKNHELPT